MSIRHEIAEFCATLTFKTLPKEIVQHTKLCLIDQICHMIVGPIAYLEDYPDISKFIKDLGGKKESNLIGFDGKVPCLNAAFVNTIMGISTSFDATHKGSIIHIPAALFPAMIAVAEARKANGKDLITAIVVGSEVMARVGISMGPHHLFARGFHPTSVCAPLGCAVGAGKLLGLSKNELAEALSIASVQASGSSVWAGAVHPATWSFQVGKAAQSGVMAAMLAQIGFNGYDKVFEIERGFLSAYSENPDPTKLTDGIGKRYEIKDLVFKRFGVGTYMITSIDTLIEMLSMYKIKPDEIDEITVKLPTMVMPLIGFPEYPVNRASTYVSTRYILAVTACLGRQIEFNMEPYSVDNRRNPKVIDLFNRIKIVGDSQLDKLCPEKKPCIVTVKKKDGKRFSQRNDGPFKGDPENPLSAEDLERKFKKMTIPILGKRKAGEILRVIKQLERLNEISQLVDLLV